MGWSVGFDTNWGRDIGYGVPAECDHPVCDVKIDRGLSYVCGGEPRGGEYGCGLYFCSKHLYMPVEGPATQLCEKCCDEEAPFEPKPDVAEWVEWKMTDPSWAGWRKEQGLG